MLQCASLNQRDGAPSGEIQYDYGLNNVGEFTNSVTAGRALAAKFLAETRWLCVPALLQPRRLRTQYRQCLSRAQCCSWRQGWLD